MRQKKILVYSKGIFCSAIRSAQRSESVNSFFEKYVSKKNSLMDSFVHFNRGLNRLRHNEFDTDRKSLHVH